MMKKKIKETKRAIVAGFFVDGDGEGAHYTWEVGEGETAAQILFEEDGKMVEIEIADGRWLILNGVVSTIGARCFVEAVRSRIEGCLDANEVFERLNGYLGLAPVDWFVKGE